MPYKKRKECILCNKTIPKGVKYSKYCSTECQVVYRRTYRQLWYKKNRERLNEYKREWRAKEKLSTVEH